VLGAADLRVRVDGDTARGAFSATGETFRSGVERVHLLSGATLTAATAAAQPVALVAEHGNQLALVNGPGPFSLNLEWGAPLVFQPGRASFVLPVPPAGTVRATIDLPGEQADVHLSAGLVNSRTAGNGRTVIEATLVPGKATEVWWSMRDSAPTVATRELRALADVLTLITIGDARRPHERARRSDRDAGRAAHACRAPARRLRAHRRSPATRSNRASRATAA
jgi:hypothetical protein